VTTRSPLVFGLLASLVLAAVGSAPAARPAPPQAPLPVGENDRVRVFRVRWAPGEGQPMRPRPLRVVVWLTDAVLELKVPKAKRRSVLRRALTIEAASPDTFSLTNAGATPVEAVEVELKPGSSTPPLPDALADEPARLQVLMDNRRVRILQLRLPPRASSLTFGLGGRVSIPLTAGSVAMTFADGRKEERKGEAYEVRVEPAARFSVENLGNDSYELLTVEPKPFG